MHPSISPSMTLPMELRIVQVEMSHEYLSHCSDPLVLALQLATVQMEMSPRSSCPCTVDSGTFLEPSGAVRSDMFWKKKGS